MSNNPALDAMNVVVRGRHLISDVALAAQCILTECVILLTEDRAAAEKLVEDIRSEMLADIVNNWDRLREAREISRAMAEAAGETRQ